MFERFTEEARKVMALARREALDWSHEVLEPEHILLGLLRLNSREVEGLLERMSIEPDAIRAELLKGVVAGSEKNWGQIPFTPRGKRVLEEALREADALGHGSIETGHVFLGLLREPAGATADAFRVVGLTLEAARTELLRVFVEVAAGAVLRSGKTFDPRTRAWTLRLGKDALRALGRARAEAQELHYGFINTEHILLGLLPVEEGAAARLLERMSSHADAIRSEILKKVPRAPTRVRMETEIPFTPRTKSAIEEAVREADTLGHRSISSGHLLLGLLRHGDSSVNDVLRGLGLILEATRAELIKVIGG